MSYGMPQQPTTQDRIAEGIIKYIHEEADLLDKKRDLILTAFEVIGQSVIRDNTSETIAKARKDIVTRAAHKTELDLSSYNISRADIAKFQADATIITEALSYTLDVLIRIVEKLQHADILKDVNLQNLQSTNTMAVDTGERKGWLGRINDFFFGFESQERQEFVKAIALLETKLREIQYANNRWRTWKIQRLKFMEMATFYSEDGKNFNHMYAMLLTEVMDFYDMQERVLPILSAGLRIYSSDMLKIFTQISNSMAQQATANQQAQMMSQGWAGLMPRPPVIQPQQIQQAGGNGK